jgi:hypothetical protein
MTVRFLRNYRGKLTNEIYYPAGASVSLPNGEALQLIADGVCVAVVAQESHGKGKGKGK